MSGIEVGVVWEEMHHWIGMLGRVMSGMEGQAELYGVREGNLPSGEGLDPVTIVAVRLTNGSKA